ncbi:hypothetical protein [Hymenobacter convexus]|uniref:hypothetical protein n=1 Tax=Hymenobacter sp. CA1UV-4 TaxID=3063782 RepID=UPI0027134BE9|nr:hypothetical protein [Hymenobacter sp. CA1UV-4]MDO7853148.1 hypothetical protein [Hymenobacter sp. CA1UV-4]
MDYKTAIDQLKLVQQEMGNASSVYALDSYVDRAARIISAVELQPQHQPGPGSMFVNKEFDIRHDAIQSLGYTLDREGGWAKNSKRTEAQRFLNKAIHQLQADIDNFISTLQMETLS